MPQHTLVTLLGKVKDKQYKDKNYRSATYAFTPTQHNKSRFFGLALCEQIKPDKLVVLGTTASMWDNLLHEAKLLEHDETLFDAISELEEAAQEDRVTQQELDIFADYLSNILAIPCTLCLIPYGKTSAEQTEILEIIVRHFDQNDTATLDVTHGLRHLPMLVQQSALLLQNMKQVTINNIYYGALDLIEKGITPVMKINGLLELNRWNQALSSYDKDGDYAVFAPLLQQARVGEALINMLKEAAFYEQTNNVGQARGRLRNFLKGLEVENKHSSPLLGLFLPALKVRFAWVEGNKLWIRQTEVAWLMLENGDFLRACIYGFEAFITKLVQEHNKTPDNRNHREEEKEFFENTKPKAQWRYYKLLRNIRNQLAHSNTSKDGDVIKAVSSQQELKATLKNTFTVLIPHETN